MWDKLKRSIKYLLQERVYDFIVNMILLGIILILITVFGYTMAPADLQLLIKILGFALF